MRKGYEREVIALVPARWKNPAMKQPVAACAKLRIIDPPYAPDEMCLSRPR
jgi:hypothetical protein